MADTPTPGELAEDPLARVPASPADLPSQAHFDASHAAAAETVRGHLAGNWFDQNAPPRPTQDWFAANAPSAEKPKDTNTVGQGVKDTLSGLWKTVTASGTHLKDATDKAHAGDHVGAALDVLKASLPGYDAIVAPAIEQATKAAAAAKAGRYSEAVGHGAAALLPAATPFVPGAGALLAAGAPAVANITDTATGEPQMPPGQQIEEPHAGEPYRAAGQAAATAALSVGPKIVGDGARAAGVPEMLRTSAEKEYGQTLNATTKQNKYLSQQVAPELIDRGVKALTLKGLQQKAQGQVASLGQAIGDAWDNLPKGSSTSLKPVYDRLQSVIDNEHSVSDSAGKSIPKGPEAERAIGNIQSLQQTLLDVAETDPQTGELRVPVDKIHGLRQYFDSIAARAGRYGGKDLADQSTAEAHGIAADSIREELGKDHPDIGALNKEYSFWKNVDKVVGDTITRREGQAKPLGRKIAAAAGTAGGMAVGGVGGAFLTRAALETLESATTSPGWRTVSAVIKDRLAKAIAKGNSQTAAGYIQAAAAQAARGSATAAPQPQFPQAADDGKPQEVAAAQ